MKKGNTVMIVILGFCVLASIIGIIHLFVNSPKTVPVSSKNNFFSQFTDKRPGLGIVKVYGPIMTAANNQILSISERGCDGIVKQMEAFRRDRRVKAVILRINSPGGSIGASQEIYEEVIKVKKEGKKVIVSMGDVAASGGYYIAAAADRIFANKGTLTGSIGVISAGLNLKGLMAKYGVKMNVIKQGKVKDIFAYWRDMTDEERKLMQALSKNVYEQFLDAVSKGRNIPKNDLRSIAEGRIYTGEQALKIKLVDELGGFMAAVKYAARNVGLDQDNPHLITSSNIGFKQIFELINQQTSTPKHINFLDSILSQSLPLLYYCSVPMPTTNMINSH